jgi:hypothetical protein
MENEIKAGDVVTLKSGGTPMTVECLGSGPAGAASAHVIWAMPGKDLAKSVIAVIALKKAQ